MVNRCNERKVKRKKIQERRSKEKESARGLVRVKARGECGKAG